MVVAMNGFVAKGVALKTRCGVGGKVSRRDRVFVGRLPLFKR